MTLPGWLRADGEGAILAVRVTPKAAADAVDGPVTMADGATWLAVRVRAAPDKGAANAAVAATIARALGVRKSGVALVSGGTARLKRFRVDRAPRDVLAALGGEA
ncbi:DUF167 family protein [Acuticoccus sp. I52.16.1]|uniref:DUF167 family protein n=1 Tax=Acuticoccus sp. I52.16.1 TaxID=2928472 RepID=UPI001FD11D00|nr:DUF167 family protein [Acuticoccus sp. I52.16.1]UOM33384.1 DUF167 family protein [Acuticoccus sp. I52.16.1]